MLAPLKIAGFESGSSVLEAASAGYKWSQNQMKSPDFEGNLDAKGLMGKFGRLVLW